MSLLLMSAGILILPLKIICRYLDGFCSHLEVCYECSFAKGAGLLSSGLLLLFFLIVHNGEKTFQNHSK